LEPNAGRERARQPPPGRLTETLSEHARRRLEALDHALERAQRGQLGRCERCGGTIPIGRLRALPGTTLCIACARAGEAGAR
jgi:DnaK suppressor protein